MRRDSIRNEKSEFNAMFLRCRGLVDDMDCKYSFYPYMELGLMSKAKINRLLAWIDSEAWLELDMYNSLTELSSTEIYNFHLNRVTYTGMYRTILDFIHDMGWKYKAHQIR